MNKPSDTLTSDDVRNMRRGKIPDGHNGNDYKYKGGRGIICFYLGSSNLRMGG